VSTKPHDAFVRATFSQPEHARGELMHLLPGALSARLDWSTLTLAPSSFVDEGLEDSQSDLLFTIELDGRPAFLYLLFEHQSTADPLLVYRELKYEVRIWDEWLEANPKARKLPAIVPILLSHAPGGWSAATQFEQLLDLDEDAMALVADFVPRFRLLVDDLSAESDEALRARSMTALGRIALWCLKTARNADELLAGMASWADLLRAVKAAPNGAAAIALVWRYLFTVHEAPERRVLPALAAVLKEEQEKDMASIADQLIEKGMLRGLERGRQEGIEKGERIMLARMLERRFGELPGDVRERIEQASLGQLERWADRVLSAQTLAEVMAP
jgi:predicted transposase/invertase (TIGR01784 family)